MASHKVADHHIQAAAHHRSAADNHELAAESYTHGRPEEAAHYALLAHAHMQHAGQFMSDAAKIHAELHGGNKHTKL
jgi:alpha-D-ribose 1-methylphosphonate 5-triphosphate synthase subunit PhnG